MDFPFETTTEDGRKVTVMGTMPGGQLVGFLKGNRGFFTTAWASDGDHVLPGTRITLPIPPHTPPPLQVETLTAYMTRGGAFAWTTGLLRGNRICGVTAYGEVQWWNINNGRCAGSGEELEDLDLIEKLPSDTME